MKSFLLDLKHLPAIYISDPLINNVLRLDVYNTQQMKDFVGSIPYALQNQNVLVGLLQNLSIDPEWSAEYVVQYVKFRSKSLCSAFSITSPNNVGKVKYNVLCYGGCHEHLCLLEDDRDYDYSNIQQDDLTPFVPMYSTLTTYSYLPPIELERKPQIDYSNDYVIIGINLVELALGWWLYMNDPVNEGLGIHTYIPKLPSIKFKLLLNQFSLFNGLYEYFVKENNIDDLLKYENVIFNTMSMDNRLNDHLSFQITKIKDYPIKSHTYLLSLIQSSLTPDLFELFDDKEYNAEYYGTMIWCLEAKYIRYAILYLSIINDQDRRGDWLVATIIQYVPLIKNRLERIGKNTVVTHLFDQLDLLMKLAKLN